MWVLSRSLVTLLQGEETEVIFTLIHSPKAMEAQDFNVLLATDSYKVGEPVLLNCFCSFSDF